MKKNKIVLGLALTLGMVSVTAFAQQEAHAADMHRLYNKNSGEHFYTADTNEKNHLVGVGWNYEGFGWTAPDSGDAVYRLYNKNAGDHHYTMDWNEKESLVKVGWNYEGIGWYSDAKRSIPLYRAYNPNAKAGSHNYTMNGNEQKMLLGAGWRDEGIAWYGINKSAPTPAPSSQFAGLKEKTPTYSASMSAKFESALNAYRVQKGVKALPISGTSRGTSQAEAQANTSTNYQSWRAVHGPGGIATTFAKVGSATEDQAVAEAMANFKGSPLHNAAMLEADPDFASDFGGGAYVMRTNVNGQNVYSFVFVGTFGW